MARSRSRENALREGSYIVPEMTGSSPAARKSLRTRSTSAGR